MFLKDRLSITTDREYTDEGFLIVPARISRVGIQEYFAAEMGLTDREPTDIIKVFRPEEEVFSEQSLKSFQNKPVTDNHPPELVTAKNSKQFSVGHSGPEVLRDGDFAKTILHVTDADAIAKIQSGKVELSNGYTADIDWTPGVTPDGEQYDAVQRNIKGNHIAIVERGRAGPACRVADNLPKTGDEIIMIKITIDGVDFEVSDQAAQAVGKLQARLTDTEHGLEEEKKKLKDKEEEEEDKKKEDKSTNDALQAKLDDAVSKIPNAETLDKLVTDRTAIVDSVLRLVPDFKWQGKDAETLRKEVIALKCPDVKMDSVSTAYIDARFDMLVEAESAIPNTQHLDNALSIPFKDKEGKVVDTRPLDVIAREKMMADSRDAWKQKGGAK